MIMAGAWANGETVGEEDVLTGKQNRDQGEMKEATASGVRFKDEPKTQ